MHLQKDGRRTTNSLGVNSRMHKHKDVRRTTPQPLVGAFFIVLIAAEPATTGKVGSVPIATGPPACSATRSDIPVIRLEKGLSGSIAGKWLTPSLGLFRNDSQGNNRRADYRVLRRFKPISREQVK